MSRELTSDAICAEPDPDHPGAFCDRAEGHDGEHSASGFCRWPNARTDVQSEVHSVVTGRIDWQPIEWHPLPSTRRFAEQLRSLGANERRQLVEERKRAIVAERLAQTGSTLPGWARAARRRWLEEQPELGGMEAFLDYMQEHWIGGLDGLAQFLLEHGLATNRPASAWVKLDALNFERARLLARINARLASEWSYLP